MPKPRTAAGYAGTQVDHVRATCLYMATKLGDLLDELVVVGGLVPSLLIDQDARREKHVGTLDLDVGMTLAIFDGRRYQVLTERLRQAGFAPDTNEKGNPTRQRWKIDGPPSVLLDFLIPPSREGDRGGLLRDIEEDFAAIIAPALHLAFVDRVRIALSGETIRGEQASREVWVCGPAAFVVMKAFKACFRGESGIDESGDVYAPSASASTSASASRSASTTSPESFGVMRFSAPCLRQPISAIATSALDTNRSRRAIA